jgi:hypothetical protein
MYITVVENIIINKNLFEFCLIVNKLKEAEGQVGI